MLLLLLLLLSSFCCMDHNRRLSHKRGKVQAKSSAGAVGLRRDFLNLALLLLYY